MNTMIFAARSAFRNKRRSIITIITVVIGTIALCLFGGFVNSVNQGIETGIVRSAGQLHIHKDGFFEFGAGRATDYDIPEYNDLITIIRDDIVLNDLIEVVTPVLSIGGIAGNYQENSSQTFVGVGLIPSDQNRMRKWNAYGSVGESEEYPLSDSDQGGFIGTGLAKVLSLCDELNIPNCQDEVLENNNDNVEVDPSILALQEDEIAENGIVESGGASIELLSASANGAPNIVRLAVMSAETQGQKAIDDRFVAMPLQIAQQLVYGQGERRITSVVVQLKSSSDIAVSKKRLQSIFEEQGLGLEVKSFEEFNLSYARVTSMFATIFGFISFVIAIVVLFTIINNLSMSVMERYNEIGTLRSIGVRRSLIRKQFVWEGAILGIAGATLGLVLGSVIVALINSAGITWTPPSNTDPQPLILNLFSSLKMPIGIWGGLVIVTAISSLPPANRASKMSIVDALRHN